MKKLIEFYPELVTEVVVEDKKEPNDDIRAVMSCIKDIENRNLTRKLYND